MDNDSKKPFWDSVMLLYMDSLIMNGSVSKTVRDVCYICSHYTHEEIAVVLKGFLRSDYFIQKQLRDPIQMHPKKCDVPSNIILSADAFCEIITDYPREFMEKMIPYVDRNFPNQDPLYDNHSPLHKIVQACACVEDGENYINLVFEHFPVTSDVIVFLYLFYEKTWEKFVHLTSRCVDKRFLVRKVLVGCTNEGQIDSILPILKDFEKDESILEYTLNAKTLRFLCDHIALPRKRGLIAHIESPRALAILFGGKAYNESFDDVGEAFVTNALFLEAIRKNCHSTIQYLHNSMGCKTMNEDHVEQFLKAERGTQALIETIFTLKGVFKKATLKSITSSILALKKHSVYLLRILTRFMEERCITPNFEVVDSLSHIFLLCDNLVDVEETLETALPFIDHTITAHMAMFHPTIMKIAHDKFSLRFICSDVLKNPIKNMFTIPTEYSICDESKNYLENKIQQVKKSFEIESMKRVPCLTYSHDSTKLMFRPMSDERYHISFMVLKSSGSNPYFVEHYFHNARALKCFSRNAADIYVVTIEFGDFDEDKSYTPCTHNFTLTQRGTKQVDPHYVLNRERWKKSREVEKSITKYKDGVPQNSCYEVYSTSVTFENSYFVKIIMADE